MEGEMKLFEGVGLPGQGPESDSPTGSPKSTATWVSSSTRHELHVPFHLAEFDLDACADAALEPGEGHGGVLSASADQQLLIKTVTNEDWVQLIRQLQGPRFRSSTSLPPPGGKGMRFFGKVPGSCLGLIWDRTKLDLSEAFIWPSGYFAKSHFNVDTGGKLLNGRGEALVTIEEVMRANASFSSYRMGRGSPVIDELLPYNEVMTYLEGTRGLAGIFARSSCVMHLLWAMGVHALLLRTLPAAGELPLFVHDPEHGLRPFGRTAQAKVVSMFLQSVQRPTSQLGLPCFPIDANTLNLRKQEQLEFHGAYGLTEEALDALVTSLLAEDAAEEESDTNSGDHDKAWTPSTNAPAFADSTRVCANKARAILAVGLHAAVEANNAASALSLVRRLAPLLFTADGEDDGESTAVASPLSVCTPDSLAPSPEVRDTGHFAACLHVLAAKAHSPSLLATVGATLALDDFASGRMLPRIEDACRRLRAWLDDSRSVLFRLHSWHELSAHHGAGQSPTIGAFLSQKAIANRTHFYQDLLELEKLEESHDLLHGMSKLHNLVDELHHPCLRLEMLQYILGLDGRYDLQAVANVANIAYGVVSQAVKFGVVTPQGKPREVLSTNTGYAPLFQLEAAACRMQGIDPEGEGKVSAPVRTF